LAENTVCSQGVCEIIECVWAADLHGFSLEVEGEKAGKSLHTYANQLHEIIAGEAGCGRGFTSYGTQQ